MEFRVLGPIEVLESGHRLDIGGPKQRTVLAMLVANAGRPLSTDRLIEAAYGNNPDAARRSVQTYVSTLRSQLGDMITSVSGGYEFTPIDSSVDAERFAIEVEAARALSADDPSSASAGLAAALAIWRGHPFQDVEARGELDTEIKRLNELRLLALESRIDADLASGRDGDLVGELDALTVEHPFRESFHSQSMLALYRSGRQAEALRAYTRLRESLAAELGVDPSPALRELEQRILDQDPTLALSPVSRLRRRAVVVIDLSREAADSLGGPDERRRALASIDLTVETAVADAGGSLAAQQATATYGTFDDVRSAIDAVAVISRRSPRSDGYPVVRMAVDVGQVEEEPTGAIAGPAVIRVSGLVAAAHDGQVLLSADAQAAVADDSAGGVVIRALGRHPIARLEEPETVHQLVVEGLPDEFPPIRTGEAAPQLPAARAGVPGYELREEIGHGLFGTVYRGYQPSVGREVAVKVIRPELANSTGFIRRFAVEAQMIARIEHPNVVPLYDFWRGPEGALLVMRLMRGGNLADWSAVNNVGREQALSLVDQVGGALATAHELGIAHGDVQASNVLLDDSGGFFLGDFGIAGDTPTLGGGMAQQADVSAFAAMVLAAVAPGALEESEAAILEAGRAGEYSTAADLLGAWSRAVTVAASSETFTATRNPYKGLAAFSELDAPDFHGRDELINELMASVASNRLVAAVGPSGIGKSSVVRAGLLPALRGGAIQGSEEWLIADCVPGSHPFERLATSLMRVASAVPHNLETVLTESDRGLVKAVERYLPAGSTLLLVVDQFEELFTLTQNAAIRDQFLDLLTTSVQDPAGAVRVLITMRADFFDGPLRHPAFGELLRVATVPISAPTDVELRQIIEDPARGVDVDFEQGLVERIVGEVQGQAGALPLVEFALTELFAGRDSDTMRLSAYESSGGVTAALGRRAEAVYASLDAGAKDAARPVLMRLVTPGEGGSDTRRRVRMSELERLGLDPGAVDSVLTAFGEHRLLTFDRDEVTRGSTVEVAHEALLREWPRLTGWIDGHREELVLRGRLGVAVTDWNASDRAETYLLTGGRLTQHEAWVETTDLLLSSEERELLDRSRTAEDDRTATRRRRRRFVMSGFAAAAVVGVVLATVALNEAQGARLAAEEAELASIISRSAAVGADEPEVSLLLALEANRRAPGPETEQAVLNALGSSKIGNRLSSIGSVFDPSGPCIAPAAARDGTGEFAVVNGVMISRDPLTGIVVEHGAPPAPCVAWMGAEQVDRRLAMTEDGMRMWFGPYDGPWEVEKEFEQPTFFLAEFIHAENRQAVVSFPNDVATVTLLDTTTGEPVGTPISGGDHLVSEALSADGSLFALSFGTFGRAEGDGKTIILDAVTGDEISHFTSSQPAAALEFDTATGELIAAISPRTIMTLDPATSSVVASVETTTSSDFLDIGVRPDGLIAVVTNGQYELVDRRAGPTGTPVALRDLLFALVRPDGTLFTVNAAEDSTGVVDPDGNALIERTFAVDPFVKVAFNGNRAGTIELPTGNIAEVIDLSTGERSTTELFTSQGDRFLAHSVYPEADGLWAISFENVFARWEGDQLVEQIDLGGESGGGTRYADVYAAVWTQPDGNRVASLINLEHDKASVVFTVPAPDASTTIPTLSNGMHVLDEDGTLHSYDASGSKTGEFVTGAEFVNIITIDPATGRLALAGAHGVVIADPATETAEILPGIEKVSNLGFAHDGELLAINSFDGTVRLWDLVRGASAGLVWDGSGAVVGSPSWYDEATDSIWVASSGKLLQIPVKPDRWIERACEVVGRDFTQDEWDRYVPGDEPLQSACT